MVLSFLQISIDLLSDILGALEDVVDLLQLSLEVLDRTVVGVLRTLELFLLGGERLVVVQEFLVQSTQDPDLFVEVGLGVAVASRVDLEVALESLDLAV